ncbi:P-loop NTPase fold protein [Limnoraphis robusta]|uniref:P-loop NTPase fold protein n=1 Tax=Limnoraphis robusta TaxID=1118279 RepID=UPI00066E2F5F|nr:P-loop NTPase fold protein [Limnoraphis robusta]
MTHSNVHSPLEDIKSALLEKNPFSEYSVCHNHIWNYAITDVKSLNAHASNAVLQALKQNQTTSIVVTAEYGTGKSHIISRLRHQLQTQGNTLFVYANQYGNLNQDLKNTFQKILANSLKKVGHQEVKQWQELATAMINHVLKVVKPQPNQYDPPNLVEKFQKASLESISKKVEQFTRAFHKKIADKNPDIIKAIFWTLSPDQFPYAVKWLAGEEIAQCNANELRLPTQSQSFETVVETLAIISQYNKILICFDELDSKEFNEQGFTKAQIVAGLIKELFENLSNGVILSVMLPAVWQDKIKKADLSWQKVSAYGEALNLKFMDEESVVELVKLRLNQLYKETNLTPPYPLYPFDETELRKLGKTKSETVRRVLTWCKEKLPQLLDPQVSSPEVENKVQSAFNIEMQLEIDNYIDDNYSIADALLFGFRGLIGQTIERVLIKDVTESVNNKSGKDNYINFKIIGTEDGKKVKIGVAVLQYTGGNSLGAGLRRLTQPENFGIELTRSCLVRSKDRKMTPYIQNTYITPLIEKGGEYVELKEDELKPLIAIRSVYNKREVEYQLTKEEIEQFIAEKGAENLLGASNPLLQEILSDPSYIVPDDMIEEELFDLGVLSFEEEDASDEQDLANF